MGQAMPVPLGGSKRSESESLRCILESMRKLQTRPKCVINVSRSDILTTGMSYLKQPGVELSPIGVRLVTRGVVEDVTDLGGPLREFFTLFFKELLKKTVDMFEGQDQGRHLFPVNNENAIANEWFKLLGKAIVLSLLSGGPGFPYLAPCVVSYLRGSDYTDELTIGNVYNVLLRQFIRKINHADTQETLDDVVIYKDTERFIDHCGWPRKQMITIEGLLFVEIRMNIFNDLFLARLHEVRKSLLMACPGVVGVGFHKLNMGNRLLLTQTLLKWELVGKRLAAFDQLKTGLNTLDFLDRARNVDVVTQYLMHIDGAKTTANYLQQTLKEEINELTPKNDEEKKAKEFTLTCMSLMTDDESTMLFHFITGMSELPVEEIPIEVEFNRSNPKAELPEAITCIQRLKIPLGNKSKMAFLSSFHKALDFGLYGFGRKDSI